MKLLRIYASLHDLPLQCAWALLDDDGTAQAGQGPLAELPQGGERVHLVIPAAQVLIVHSQLPKGARRDGELLSYAVEELTADDPASNQVSWLGNVAGEDVLAVIDKAGLAAWLRALTAAGRRIDAVHSETLLLPVQPGEWSLAWNGQEGFVRCSDLQGSATDCGDRQAAPLLLQLLLASSKTRGTEPTAIALYLTAPDAAPDLASWQAQLGTRLRLAGDGDWRTAAQDAGIALPMPRRRWRGIPEFAEITGITRLAARLRPAAWIVAATLVLHGGALIVDWTQLLGEQRALRQQMEARFRASFPEAVAVVDPALQMRRNLATARHKLGLADRDDLLPMLAQVAAATKELPAGTVRALGYENGRLTIALAAKATITTAQFLPLLRQAGLIVDVSTPTATPPPAAATAGSNDAVAATVTTTITVRAS